jgi:flagellar motor switch/type III secretory pathway protein FliN
MSSATARALSPAAAEKPRAASEPEKLAQENLAPEKLARKVEQENANTEARWRPVLGLPCELTVDLPLPGFKVADFLALRPGSVVGTNWRLARDIPLRINGTLIGWAEFEGAGNRMAVRVTELA